MKIAFLCVANSARSQMAEGMARLMAPAGVEVCSAGSAPAGVNPFAIKALDEVGVDARSHTSTSVNDLDPATVDVVVTLCAEEVCPVLLAENAERLHWPIDDPAGGEGDDEAQLERFRSARERIREHLREYFRRMTDSPPAP
jgi:arsenate reductase